MGRSNLPKGSDRTKAHKCRLLIDADIVAYQSVSNAMHELPEVDDQISVQVDMAAAREEASSRIEGYLRELKASGCVLCFGSISNFRKQLYPEYKRNRAKRKPFGYEKLVEWMESRWPSERRGFLEADDLIGLMHTSPYDGATVSVSEDKDLTCIPGLLYNPRRPESGVLEISKSAAAYNHMRMTLCGDTTDGYPGCKGVGAVKAEAILAGTVSAETMWERVVAAFAKSGKDARFALTQARLAFILHDGYYDWDNGMVRMWDPPGSTSKQWMPTQSRGKEAGNARVQGDDKAGADNGSSRAGGGERRGRRENDSPGAGVGRPVRRVVRRRRGK